jgi:tRNA modification GTPase
LQDSSCGNAADEVVVTVKRVDPELWIEIHCHGGREALGLLLEMLAKRGVQVCAWQDLEHDAASDPARAAALIALTEARTVRTAAILLDQYHGAFTRSLAMVQAAWQANDLVGVTSFLQELVRYAGLGRHLTVPWQVAILGPPNVGKSSLINALAGFQRSVVAATPGTTRDVVTTTIAVDGWPVELADTAGFRAHGGVLEQLGMERAVRTAAQADLCFWVLDSSSPPLWPDFAGKALHFIVNKIDLPAAADFAAPPNAIFVSAKTGQGLDDLCKALTQWLVPDAPPAGADVPFTAALCDKVEKIYHWFTAGRFAEARDVLNRVWE